MHVIVAVSITVASTVNAMNDSNLAAHADKAFVEAAAMGGI